MKPRHGDIIEAKEIYSQLSVERYKGKLVLRIQSPSVYVCINRLFAYCKNDNFNIHICAWFGYFTC